MTQILQVITQTESWTKEVKEDVVEALERLLEKAQAREIQGIAYSCVTIDKAVLTGFTKTKDRNGMIGGLERVKHHILAGED